MTRYVITSDSGRFLILNARDNSLAWSGDHWSERDGHVLSFPYQAAAEEYAQQTFGE